MTRVTVWNEIEDYSGQPAIAAVYPDGLNAAIAGFLGKNSDFSVTTAHLDQPECGLSDELLDNTDVLVYWAHKRHGEVPDDIADRIGRHVRGGMGVIFLHSAHFAKAFQKLMGTTCSLKWYEGDEVSENLWLVNPCHPIAAGVSDPITLEHEEMYGEFFDIPTPDESIFIGWFSTGFVFRSGNIWNRGRGKVFYFQPGHETYPVYENADIQRVIENAVRYVAPGVAWTQPERTQPEATHSPKP